MPVPDSSYSRRYGREDSYSSYTRSTSSTGLGRSYLSSYGSKASSSLPPRPPAYDIRKYTDTSSLTGSRFLSSSTGSRASVSRDYGSSYRSSVSPVRASASSIRRQLEASAPSIAERIKAIETSETDDVPSATSTSGISRSSRYSTLRAQRESPTYDSSATRSKYATYSSGYTRDRSGSREYGSSPLSVSGSSYLNRSSENKSSTENIRSRTSPAPLSRSGSGNNAAGGTSAGLRNGTAAASTEVNDSNPESSSSSAASASNSKSVLATTTTTTNKPALEKATSVVTTTPPVSNEPADEDSKSDRSSCKSKDVENNDSRRRRRRSGAGDGEVSGPSGSANCVSSTAAAAADSSTFMNGNDEDAEGRLWSRRRSTSKGVKDSVNNSPAVNMASSSSPASANNVSSSSSLGNSFNGKSGGKTASITSTTQDSNGNPIVSLTMETPKNKDSGESYESKSSVGSSNNAATASTSASTSSSRLGRFRKYESDSNANNIVVTEPTTTATPPISNSLLRTNTTNNSTPSLTNGDASTKEKSPVEAVLTFKPRSSANSSAGGSTVKPSISPSGSRTKMTNSNTSSNEVTVKPKVLYHTIQVEEPAASRENTASPEPVYTLRARPSLDGTAPKIELNKGPPQPRKEEKDKEVDAEDVSADFKIVLPKLKLSTANSSSQESVHNNKSGTSSSEDDAEGNKSSGIMKSLSSVAKRDEESPIRILRESPPKVTSVLRKSLTPKKEDSPPPAAAAIPTSSTVNSSSRKSSSSREATPTRSHLLTRKSPSPGLGSSVKSTRASPDNINASSSDASPSMGPHMSKNAYGTATAMSNIASPSNRNERMRNSHIMNATTSDSSDNDSDAYSSSPKLGGGKFRSNKDSSSGGYEKAGLTGLRNIGNTCFMNTVLQCLSNTKPLLEYVMKDNYEGDINRTTSGMKGALIRAFGELIHELWRDQRVVDTSAFKDQIQRFAPRFMGYSQQDAQEFLRYLLEGLHEDVNRVTSKPTPIHTDIDDSLSDSDKAAEAWKRYLRYENSKVFDMFVGQLKSTLKCTVCGHCSVTFDPFWDLSLPIPSRSSSKLTTCFELFTKEEVMDGDEKPTCAKCQCRRKCTKSFSIQKFPKILVVHLKRFSLAERYRGKLSTLVDYPLTGLDLSLLAATRTQGTHLYNLYGVANHSGSTYSGHYIAYCKHPYTGEWNCYNDSRVSPISPHSVVTSEGYVLFYEQAGQSSLL